MRIRKPTKPKGTRTRNKIITAFTRCIRKQGFVKTSMVDVAKEADVFPSHLAYYFDSKEDILRSCFLLQGEAILCGLRAAKEYKNSERILYLSDFFFTDNPDINLFTTGFMFEAFGVAIYDETLKNCKKELDMHIRELFSSFFTDMSGGEDYNACEKAETAYALLSGLKFTLYFDESLRLDHGKAIFEKMLKTISEMP